MSVNGGNFWNGNEWKSLYLCFFDARKDKIKEIFCKFENKILKILEEKNFKTIQEFYSPKHLKISF